MKFTRGDLIIREDLAYPDEVLAFVGYSEDGGFRAHPPGGGFELQVPAGDVLRFRPVTGAERDANLFRRAKFSLEAPSDCFAGWTNGENWNGFAKPHFEFAEAQRLMVWLKYAGARHDAARDAFVTVTMDGVEELWEATTIAITDGTRIKVYPVGAAAWCWGEEN